MNQVLGILDNAGLPIYVSELDMRGNDQQQLQRYQEKFPIFWDDPDVAGITLWGYVQGQIWQEEAWLVSSSGNPRPAMTWLYDNYINVIPGGDEHIWLETECGTLGSSWSVVSDGSASNGEGVTIQSGNTSLDNPPTNSSDHISFNFDVSEGGTYRVWGRTIAPSADDDSFWVQMDGGSWVKWNSIPGGSSWSWDDIHDSDNGGSSMNYSLNSGSHTLTIAPREDGAELDKLYVTNSGQTPSGSGSDASNCTATNNPPSANAGVDQTLTDADNSGSESVTLNGSGSSDSDGSITSYVWTEGGNQIATGVSPSVSFSVGTHSLTLTVTDNDGATDTDNVVITVNPGASNNPPVANAGANQTVTDDNNNGSESVTLNGSGSSDSDGSVTSYVWSEGGNQIATGATPSVSFSVGSHNVTLTVTDNDGATDSDNVVITVNPGSVGSDVHVWLDAECGVVGSSWNTASSGSASNGEYVSYPSGTSYDSAPSSSSDQISYTFDVSESGSYTIWGRTIAPNGDDDSFWIQANGGTWVKWNNIDQSSSWQWDEVHDADNSNQVVNFSLAAGSNTLTIAYREDGTQLDKIYITNTSDTPSGEGGASDNCGPLPNQPPVANAGSNQTVLDTDDNGSESVSLNGSASSDSDGSIVSYVWTEGANQIATGVNPSINLAVGSHTITLTVTDDEGATDSDDVVITVNAPSAETHVWLEAECGTVGSSWSTASSGSASEGSYVAPPSGNNYSSAPASSTNHISFSFMVNSSGNYVVWGRTIAPSADDDSFWVQMDGGSWTQWNNIPQSSSWAWDDVHDSQGGEATVTYNLSSGSHTLTIARREDGVELDKIYITDSGNTPSGSGSSASNCSGARMLGQEGQIVTEQLTNQTTLAQNYPNPFSVSTKIGFELANESEVKISVYNLSGQLIDTLLNERRSAGKYTVEFSAIGLRKGIYYYRFETNGFSQIKKMIIN